QTVNDWGTINPESVLTVNSKAYVFDALNGIIWRYAQDGQTDISKYGFSKRIFELSRDYGTVQTGDFKHVISGYDKQFETIYFTFANINQAAEGFTIGFEDSGTGSLGWKGDYSFVPEFYGHIENQFYSFLNGSMYRHNDTVALRCNFYGTQYNFEVGVSVNPEWDKVKTPKSFLIQANKRFVSHRIEVIAREGYPIGQESQILEDKKWLAQEGQFAAEIMRDMIDNAKEYVDIANLDVRRSTALLQGRDLKFESMDVWLRAADPTVENKIYRLATNYFVSSKNG
ncbi:MAG: hypothetical protein ACRCSC_02715, partial [Lactococcus garvieae]